MREPIVFAIDGAVTLLSYPEMDSSYKYGALFNGVLVASRDGNDFRVATEVMFAGKVATCEDMVKALWN